MLVADISYTQIQIIFPSENLKLQVAKYQHNEEKIVNIKTRSCYGNTL